MPFSPEQFINKLNTLEDTQESISNASRWLLSQSRDAPKIAENWKKYMLRPSVNSRRKLLAIYLVNHVVQQAKNQKVPQFQIALGKVIAEPLGEVYPDFSPDIKHKVKRVVKIWRERGIFPDDTMKSIEKSLTAMDSVAPKLNLPPKLKELVEQYTKVAKNQPNLRALKFRFDNAVNELNPESTVYAENYKTVQRIGNMTKDAAQNSIQEREAMITLLQGMLDKQISLCEEEQAMVAEIDFTLLSKDTTKIGGALEDNDALPTYEPEQDSDNSSSSEEEEKEKEKEEVDYGENEEGGLGSHLDNNDSTQKRNSEEESDDQAAKKFKPDMNTGVAALIDRISGNSQEEEYEVEEDGSKEGEEEEEDKGGDSTAAGVVSNIQDLLSKLAN